MKKIFTLCVLSFGVLFLAGCGQQQINKEKPPTPTPTQPIETPISNSSDCGKQGQTFDFTKPQNPKECCAGLQNVHTSDSVSVADICYGTGTESGAPIISCSNCGNGICEDNESVCGCKNDCVGKGKSKYQTVQEFCANGFPENCDKIPKDFPVKVDLCNLCDQASSPAEIETCTFSNTINCNRSCQKNSDCKFSIGSCVNIEEDVLLPQNMMPAYQMATCKCENNECVGIPTGEVAI